MTQYYDWKGKPLDSAVFGRYGSFYPVLASKHSLTRGRWERRITVALMIGNQSWLSRKEAA